MIDVYDIFEKYFNEKNKDVKEDLYEEKIIVWEYVKKHIESKIKSLVDMATQYIHGNDADERHLLDELELKKQICKAIGGCEMHLDSKQIDIIMNAIKGELNYDV